MKRYKVMINGSAYEVQVEEMAEGEVAATETKAAAPVTPGEGETISAPMPGNILSVNVTVGQQVKKGDVLMILEAMKMENEIMAPNDGTVTSVSAAKGQSVSTGDPLCTLKA